jgi:hypothetical protein
MNGFGREHEELTLLEMDINIAKVHSLDDERKKGTITYSLLRLPGMIPVWTVCRRPPICQAADPPLEWPSKLFCAMIGTAFPGVRPIAVKTSFQM